MKILSLNLVFLVLLFGSSSAKKSQAFVQCFTSKFNNSSSIQEIIYTPSSPLFYPILQYSIHNARFNDPGTPKPVAIVTPYNEAHIQETIFCAKKFSLQVRVRSGGHDFEALSSISDFPFVIVHMFNLRSITIDVEKETAWVQAGATLGEFYYAIDKERRTLAFPGGDWPSVGVGGQISGGGYGTLVRKYGLAADNVLDAFLINVNGTILDRKSMGEDLFWAIRGGGGGNFGIVYSWKLKLVAVPENVTVFTISKSLEQNATKLVYKWQHIASKLPEDLFLRVSIQPAKSSQSGKKTIQASFICLFLGGIDELLSLMQESFPELGVAPQDLTEMSFLSSVLYFDGFPIDQKEILLTRENPTKNWRLKQKADFATEPIPEEGLEGLWKILMELEPGEVVTTWTPFGARMSEISESKIPFPYRDGYLFIMYEAVNWCDVGTLSDEEALSYMRDKFHGYLSSYVSKNPRASYVNYRDLDLGVTDNTTSPEEARSWGVKYFNHNFDRLVQVKTKVDPDNFFRYQQSIPPHI